MTTRILTATLGAVTAPLVLGSLALAPGGQAVTRSSAIEVPPYVNAAPASSVPSPGDSWANFSMALDRLDLIPNVIVGPSPSYPEIYEPFIISEGWREEASLKGPFLIEDAPVPVVKFDDYDRAIIDLYE
jgi:hypothetical protein